MLERAIERLAFIRVAMADVLDAIDKACDGRVDSAHNRRKVAAWQTSYDFRDSACHYAGDVLYECERSNSLCWD